MKDMTLQDLNDIAYQLSIAAIALFMITTFATMMYKRKVPKHSTQETETASIDTFSAQPNKPWLITAAITRLLCILTLIAALVVIFIMSNINSKALSHGAYDNIQYTQTISEIMDNVDHGFEESKDIPDDLSGCLVIYFKYGCPDCNAIHDDLMTELEKTDAKIYFVSIRSEIGDKLAHPYPNDPDRYLVDQVPCIVYYFTSGDNPEIVQELLFEYDNQANVIFKTRTLEAFVEFQKENQ